MGTNGLNARHIGDTSRRYYGTLNQKILPTGGFFMSVERLELSTNGLKGRCSTIELHTRSARHFIIPLL